MEFDSTTKNRLARLALQCHHEQLMDRSRFLAAMEKIAVMDGSDTASIHEIFPPQMLAELADRLHRVASDVAEIRGEAAPAKPAASPAVAHFDAEELDETEFVPAAVDLHVNWISRIAWPVCGILVIVLLYYVITTLINSPDLFTRDRTRAAASSFQRSDAATEREDSEVPASDDPSSDSSDGEDTDFEDSEAPTAQPVASRVDILQSVDNFVLNKQFAKAIEALNDPDLESSARTHYLEAGVLLARGGREFVDEALDMLVQPQIANPNNSTWQALYATALMNASKAARGRAIEALQTGSGRAAVRPDIQRAIQWAQARGGTSSEKLEELGRRTSDFEASDYDHLFLAFSSFAARKLSQAKYHTSKAIRKRSEYSADYPEWLRTVHLTAFDTTIKKLQDAAKAQPSKTQPAKSE